MKLLAIETSCDDTGIAILEVKNNTKTDFKILSELVSSQSHLHAEFGGVFPNLAKREHEKNLPILFEKSLKKAKINPSDLNAICVTFGPGLEPALWTGIVFAENLGKKYKIPVVPVNHMEGHILSVFGIENKKTFTINERELKFPIISLLVSGGHTELVLVEKFGKYKIIGETLDDAAGEAFDKVARMLGLPYPGGPEISKIAEKYRATKNKTSSHESNSPRFPRPMLHSKNFDFSFSGLKTAVLYFIKKLEKIDEQAKIEIAHEFENAVVETLVHKTQKAIEKYNAQTLIVGGGVSANKFLRKELKRNIKNIKILFPTKLLATDNAVMIGIAGALQFLKTGKGKKNIKAIGSLKLK